MVSMEHIIYLVGFAKLAGFVLIGLAVWIAVNRNRNEG